jgi:hypothetical protein
MGSFRNSGSSGFITELRNNEALHLEKVSDYLNAEWKLFEAYRRSGENSIITAVTKKMALGICI